MAQSTTVDLRGRLASDALMNHVEHIAQWVRLSGDPDEAKAFDYIESKLREWGVKYERYTHPAYISLPGSARLLIREGLSDEADNLAGGQDGLDSAGGSIQGGLGDEVSIPCITHSMGATTPQTGITGRVVDVGNGNDEDYDRIQFSAGCIAFINGLAAPGKVLAAANHGAGGAIFVNGLELHEMIVSPVWGSPSSETVHLLPNLPIVSILGVHGAKIRATLGQTRAGAGAGTGTGTGTGTGNPLTATLHTEVLTEWREIPQLIAEIEGATYPEEVVLLGGHVDSWHYGAMDNASANAIQLESLRIFQENRESLARTFRVAFWSGHSHGRYAGSTWYADHHFSELEERVVLHMYVDSVGGKGATVLSEAWAMSETKAVAAEALQMETGEIFNGGRFARGGDQSFYGIGVSGLFMCLSEQPPEAPTEDGSERVSVSAILGGNGKTGGLGSWWHAVDDTPDKLDAAFLLRDARIYVYALAKYLVQERLELDFRPTARELRGHLEHWQALAGDHFLLEEAISACSRLESAVDELYEVKLDSASFNQAVVGLSRRLVPLNYSFGNRFEHDPALTLPPIPSLNPIEGLAAAAQAAGAGKSATGACQAGALSQADDGVITNGAANTGLTSGAGDSGETDWDAFMHLQVLVQRRANFVTQTLLDAAKYAEACTFSGN